MNILGYHTSEGKLYCSDGSYETKFFLDKLLDNHGGISLFYHLNYDVANLINMLKMDVNEINKLYTTGQVYYNPFTIKYVPGKFFSITKKHQNGKTTFMNIGDASQYYDFPLEKCNEEAAIQKAKQASTVAENVIKFFASIGIEPTSINSPIRVFEKTKLSQLSLPTYKDMPEEAVYYAYQCCKGNWLEAYQLGYWHTAYDYDLNSAYPSEICKLIDIRNGSFNHVTKMTDSPTYGYYLIDANVKSNFSPLIFKTNENNYGISNYTLKNRFPTFATKEKILYASENKIADIKIIDGWEFNASSYSQPLESTIDWLQFIKEDTKPDTYGINLKCLKRIMSGIYGKMLETRGKYLGDFFNPAWAAIIENNIHIADADFIIKNNLTPICITVDGVIAEEAIKQQSSTHIGEWRYRQTQAICMGTGLVGLNNKRNADFSINFDWLYNSIKSAPDANSYSMTKFSPITLPVAMNTHQLGKLGKLCKVSKAIKVQGDCKRLYPRVPKTGRDILTNKYQSLPLNLSFLQVK